MTQTFTDDELFLLRALAQQAPTIHHAVARIAQLRARLVLPMGTVHVFSDVHGQDEKLRHIINNASGRLQPLVDALLPDDTPEERRLLLNLVYYPREVLRERAVDRTFLGWAVDRQMGLLRALSRDCTLGRLRDTIEPAWRAVVLELLAAPSMGTTAAYIDAMLSSIADAGKGATFLRRLSRAIRNLSVEEILVAGDLGDRGPRIDKVIAYLMRQPRVRLLWGNHDVNWMGACLGHEALIAVVVRVSLRYGRLAQLQEGYGIPLEPLAHLAQRVYGDDPCARFAPKVRQLENELLVARMQKAIAVIQCKLEGQLIDRHPEWQMADRNLLHRIDLDAGTVRIGDQVVPLADANLPTLDPANPYALTADEQACMATLRRSFLHSPTLWEHMSFVLRQGGVWTQRDDHLLFHACVPVDANGARLRMKIGEDQVGGRALFDAAEATVRRAFRAKDPAAIDHLWYLWCGPVSPLFGKDRMATFESYFIEDKAHSRETKNAYFGLLHSAEFVRGVLREFGVDDARGLVVNGHVPVRADEDPVKRGGNAITIDGAFAEAYGDRGYTLLIGAHGTELAEHHSFQSVDRAVHEGHDIVPSFRTLRRADPPRTVGDTQAGTEIRREVAALERLVAAFRQDLVPERT